MKIVPFQKLRVNVCGGLKIVQNNRITRHLTFPMTLIGKDATTGLMNDSWVKTQIKSFSRWSDKHLSKIGEHVEDITQEFSDGVKLIKLLEVIGKEPIGRPWNKNPKVRFQKLENASAAISYITETKKCRLVGIGPENVVDCDVKLTLGLVWTLICRLFIDDISVEEKTARDALLIWCQKNTASYDDINITNFSTSWSSGLGFCGLIHHFRPDVLDYYALDRSDHTHNCVAAFEACKTLGISVYLDPEDLVGVTPDEKSVVLQVLEFFHYFAADAKTEALAKQLARAIAIQREIEELKSDYERLAREALEAIQRALERIQDQSYDRSVTGTKAKLVDVIRFGNVDRPDIYDKKSKAIRTWSQLLLKCKSAGRRPPTPPAGLETEVLDASFKQLDEVTSGAKRTLLSELKAKSDAYIQSAKQTLSQILAIESCLSGQLSGSDEEKRHFVLSKEPEVESIERVVAQLTPAYQELEAAEMHLEIDETPSYMTSVIVNVREHIQMLIGQIDSNIAAAKGLAVSEDQLKDYRETFNLFDKDHSATLQYYELLACLTALGEDSTEAECKEICKKYSGGQEQIDFDSYVKFMLDRFKNEDSAAAASEAFNTICQNSGIVTEEHLARYFSPEDAAFLRANLQPADGGYRYEEWISSIYA